MRRNYSQPAGSQTYQRVYGGFRGVDFTNNPLNVDPSRSPYAKNIIVDGAGVVHKRPGVKTPLDMFPYHYEDGHIPINGLHIYTPPEIPNMRLLVHYGTALYSAYNIEGTLYLDIIADLANSPSIGFTHKGKYYILDGEKYKAIFWDEATNGIVEKYVYEIATAPETQIAGYWYAEEYTEINETTHEGETKFKYTWTFGEKGERNLLTGRRINTFCGDGIHKTFWFDAQNFKVYKVEQYKYIPDQAASTSAATVTISTGTNIRSSPSTTSGDNIIANTHSTTPTCETTGKTGSWYQILWNGQPAYVHQTRATVTSGTVTTYATDKDGWETLTSGFTVSEDNNKHCTKIEFTSAPPAHPRGNGLPNIRITGAVTEIASKTYTITAGQASYGSVTLVLPKEEMATSVVSVTKTRAGTTTDITSGCTITDNGNHSISVKITSGLAEDDIMTVTYRRETFRDFSVINKCNKYGRYGLYNADRFFFTGNPDNLNRDWYSEPDDPTLVLENSYTDIGDTFTGIAGYLNYQGSMLIIKYDSNEDNLFLRTADTDEELTIFPVKAYKGRGAVSSKAIANIKGECVFLSPEGVYEFISTDLGSRYGTKEMSYTISAKLLKEDLSEGVMGVWGDWLLLSFPSTGHCYVADITQNTAPSSSGGYGWEWFYWTNINATLFATDVDNLMFASTTEEVCGFKNTSDTAPYLDEYGWNHTGKPKVEAPIVAQWSTPQDQFDAPEKYKYIEGRGAIMRFAPFAQTLKFAVVTDGHTARDKRDEAIEDERYTATDYDFTELHASPEAPEIVLNRRINRFKYVQFIFRNDDPGTDGIGLLRMDFQYRYGRYIT